MQVHDWGFDVHAWAQQVPDFFELLIMELLRREDLLVRSHAYGSVHCSDVMCYSPPLRTCSTRHRICAHTCMELFQDTRRCTDRLPTPQSNAILTRARSCLQRWKIPVATMSRFLRRVAASYRANPYHNAAHAADVTQGMAIMMAMGLSRRLSRIERLGLLLAAAVHDLGHPGVSNQFLVATRDRWALVYSDISVNENMHVSQAFMIAHEEGLFEALTPAEYTEARSQYAF
jgi:3'5'-cyclic nucleotide phosphodiesterase